MNRNALSVGALLAVLVTAGCTPHKDRSKLLQDVELLTVRMVNEHTGLPDLLIKVPSGFVVEWTKEARYEKYFIYDPKDSGDVQSGMAVIDVTPYPSTLIADSLKIQRSIGDLAGANVVWKEYSIEEPGTPTLYQREMTSNKIFAEASKYKDEAFTMHAFVVGTDHDLVEILTASVETITVLPQKPNL